MKFIALSFLVFFCVNTSFSQVIQKQPNKWQLINGVKLPTGKSMKNEKKIQETAGPISIDSKHTNDIQKKKDKVVKPLKALKYGNQKRLNSIRKEDEK